MPRDRIERAAALAAEKLTAGAIERLKLEGRRLDDAAATTLAFDASDAA